MTKQEIVELMAAKSGLTKADSERALSAFQEVVTESLRDGKKITLTGFCTIQTSRREEREGRNPRTGATVKIPARNTVSFKAGSKLKEAVNR